MQSNHLQTVYIRVNFQARSEDNLQSNHLRTVFVHELISKQGRDNLQSKHLRTEQDKNVSRIFMIDEFGNLEAAQDVCSMKTP